MGAHRSIITLARFHRWLNGQITFGVNPDEPGDYLERFIVAEVASYSPIPTVSIAATDISVSYSSTARYAPDPGLQDLIKQSPRMATARELTSLIELVTGAPNARNLRGSVQSVWELQR